MGAAVASNGGVEARQLEFWRRKATGEKAFLQLGLPVPRELGNVSTTKGAVLEAVHLWGRNQSCHSGNHLPDGMRTCTGLTRGSNGKHQDTSENLSKSDLLLDDRPCLVSFHLSAPLWVSVFGSPAWDTAWDAFHPAFWRCGSWNCMTGDVWMLDCSWQRQDYEQPSLTHLKKPKPKHPTKNKPPEFWKFCLEERLNCYTKSLLCWGKNVGFGQSFKGQNLSMIIIMMMKLLELLLVSLSDVYDWNCETELLKKTARKAITFRRKKWNEIWNINKPWGVCSPRHTRATPLSSCHLFLLFQSASFKIKWDLCQVTLVLCSHY